MANARLRSTVRASGIDSQTMHFLSNIEKRIYRLTIRLTELELRVLQDEAREADKTVSEIIRIRLWDRKAA
jgi:hypothetical protein